MTGWLTNWLTEALVHSRHSGTQALKAFEGHLRHSKDVRVLWHSGWLGSWCNRALKALGHSKCTWALGHLSTWAVGYSGTWAVVGRALGHSGTRALKALETLYLGDSMNLKVRASFLISNILAIKSFHHESFP